MADIENNISLPQPPARRGPKRRFTDEEYIARRRESARRYMAKKRQNPEFLAAHNEREKQRYHADIEKIREQRAERRIYNRDKANEYAKRRAERNGKEWVRNNNLRATYGITLQEWNTLFELQGKCCAICKCGDAAKWTTDHNHTSGKVRGILCQPCNSGIGMFRENATVLFNAIEYLKR
jgi:hypothetical protein